jgi:pyruvyltransferase
MDDFIYLYWYNSCKASGRYNVGDMLTPYLFSKMTNKLLKQADPPNDPAKQLVVSGVGSVLRDSNKSSIIWGSGIAVRGKHSLERIINTNKMSSDEINNIILGDPGLCMSTLYKPIMTDIIYKYGIVLHYVDDKYGPLLSSVNNAKYVSVNHLPEEFIDNIVDCEIIISSSLHGLVLAISYNKPVIYIEFEKTLLPKDNIKFHDFFSAFDINVQPIRITNDISKNNKKISEAIPISVNYNMVQDIANKLLNSIPLDNKYIQNII